MTQRDHAASGAGTTQCGAILARLEAAGGDWVPMPELAHASGAFAVHSRVSDLRIWGYVIEQRSERVGRKIRSFYRLANPTTTE